MNSLLRMTARNTAALRRVQMVSNHYSRDFFKISFKKRNKATAKEDEKSQSSQQAKQPKSTAGEEQNPQSSQQAKQPNSTQKVATISQSIADQRAKWMAKVSPEMQKKAQLAANRGAANETLHSFPSTPPMPISPQKIQETNEAFRGSCSESQRKSWMNRMQGSQQQKQAQWVKEMQAKQQAGRQMQQQKLQKIKEQTNAQAPESNASSGETDEATPEPKSPERLAYLEAVTRLNSYQVLKRVPGRITSKPSQTQLDPIVEQTLACLHKTGLDQTDLESIPVIQIAGTKGRGSTCRIVENILQAHGVKTGVLSSPHLFSTTERIHIDGEPISEAEFTQLFWLVHDQLIEMKPLPTYNKLLTVMAFHAFRNAAVDVAIVEVGNGCASDPTNICLHAQTIGISTLGWEQNFNLGNSMRDIAWTKAAIMKPGASIYTSVTQPECCEVLNQGAKKLGVELHRVPAFHEYIEKNLNNKKTLSNANYSMRLNGSLGIQLAYDYLRRYKPEYIVGLGHNSVQLTQGTARGVDTYERPGQFDIIKYGIFNVYLDCADTLESMMACRDWFYSRTRSNRSPKILLFNKVNEVNAKDLLTVIRMNVRFDEAGFVPNPNYFEGETIEQAPDSSKAMVWHGMEDLQRARRNAGSWRALCEETGKKDNSQISISIPSYFEYLNNKYAKQTYGKRSEVDVLVTGSGQLVAATISHLQKLKGLNTKI
ncbi:LOW QUALITY PROTEIN: uncharacterized protein Fpgs2 [Drosophila tropicalis]|uniref:LOW QUALITY PROTEIN: uncharacterized protein Fpgs2 n=1 Tax=Drosophila tropicalis TaxID=46794 RepID=UPI0035AB826D